MQDQKKKVMDHNETSFKFCYHLIAEKCEINWETISCCTGYWVQYHLCVFLCFFKILGIILKFKKKKIPLDILLSELCWHILFSLHLTPHYRSFSSAEQCAVHERLIHSTFERVGGSFFFFPPTLFEGFWKLKIQPSNSRHVCIPLW